MKTLAFFNQRRGSGATSLVYHLARMFSERGLRVLLVDLDPQAELTARFMDDCQVLEMFWPTPCPMSGGLHAALQGHQDRLSFWNLPGQLCLLPGDPALSCFDDRLASAWLACKKGEAAAFEVMAAFWRSISEGSASCQADLVMIDLGPNLGALNRMALLAADHVAIPLRIDRFFQQNLKLLGQSLDEWRSAWQDSMRNAPPGSILPKGHMRPLGYVLSQESVRFSPDQDKVPAVFHQAILGETAKAFPALEDDPYALAVLRHYPSLESADGAIGADIEDACYQGFSNLAQKIADKLGLELNPS